MISEPRCARRAEDARTAALLRALSSSAIHALINFLHKRIKQTQLYHSVPVLPSWDLTFCFVNQKSICGGNAQWPHLIKSIKTETYQQEDFARPLLLLPPLFIARLSSHDYFSFILSNFIHISAAEWTTWDELNSYQGLLPRPFIKQECCVI